jgi:hypothetical protein
MYPHRIRLRGPWDCEPLAHPAAAPFQAAMPCRWAEAGRPDLEGPIRCRRRFGYPGRIDSHERVWLTFAGVADCADVTLNGTALGSITGPADFDVTALLRPRNELVADVEGPGLWGEVALEVRCTAYLRGVRAWVEQSDLHVSGQVVGFADKPLDLYVIADRSVLAEAQVTAEPGGRLFHLAARWTGQAVSVQVDLVNGAVVWYTITQELALQASGPEA